MASGLLACGQVPLPLPCPGLPIFSGVGQQGTWSWAGSTHADRQLNRGNIEHGAHLPPLCPPQSIQGSLPSTHAPYPPLCNSRVHGWLYTCNLRELIPPPPPHGCRANSCPLGINTPLPVGVANPGFHGAKALLRSQERAGTRRCYQVQGEVHALG